MTTSEFRLRHSRLLSARPQMQRGCARAGLGVNDIRPILDLEDFGDEELGPNALADWIQDWVDEVVDATGKRAIIYTRSFWIAHLGQLLRNFDTDLWVPRYSDSMLDPILPQAWDRHLFWQWAGSSGDDFFPHDIGPVRQKLGSKAQLTVAGRKVDQNVGADGITLDDLVVAPAEKVERWVVSATWREDGERHVRDLCEPTKLERLGAAVRDSTEEIARHRKRGHQIRLRRMMITL